MITAAGAGASTWRALDVTRWREDATRDCWGQFCYVRDLGDGTAWSVGHQPLCRAGRRIRGRVPRRPGRVPPPRRRRRDPPGPSASRRTTTRKSALVTLINHGGRPRDARPDQLRRGVPEPPPRRPGPPGLREAVPGDGVRPRSGRPAGPPPAAGRGPEAGLGRPRLRGGRGAGGEYETDRARFLGRGRTPANPAALDRGARLSGTTGPVLDPVFSLRRRVRLAPGATASVAFVTGAADTREAALALAEQFRDLGR